MKKSLALILVIVMLLSALSGIASAQEKHYKIAYVPTTMNNAFWLALEGPIKEEVEKRGDEYISVDAQNDQARMNDMIGDLIAQKIDILLVAPQDSAGIESALVDPDAEGAQEFEEQQAPCRLGPELVGDDEDGLRGPRRRRQWRVV